MSVSSKNDEARVDGKESVQMDEAKANPVLDPALRIEAERALTWKLDLRLMPMIALIFIMNYIGELAQTCLRIHSLYFPSCTDRTAVTAARLQGMEKDLGISGL
jgi:hypothetical protein